MYLPVLPGKFSWKFGSQSYIGNTWAFDSGNPPQDHYRSIADELLVLVSTIMTLAPTYDEQREQKSLESALSTFGDVDLMPVREAT